MRWEALAPLLIVASALLIAAIERLRPYDSGQRLLREGFWTDLVGYGVIQSYLCALLIGALLRRMAPIERGIGSWPVAAQVAFFVVTHDFYIYWFHRWQHASPWLWRLHEAHHSAREVDWLTALRSHALEILINQTIEFAPMVLLGADPAVPLIKSAVGAAWGLYIHSNIGVHTGRLQWVVNGPEAHRWHHAIDQEAWNRNFATKLALWDRLFGSAFLPAGRKPSGYGLSGFDFPRGYLRQQLFAFRTER
jgi:sterol desaturase/sphingolipid hydroxylase (fatty acid hydroxylase superfamily)